MPIAHGQHLLQGTQVDAVLALVVGGAPAIPAVTVHHHDPGLQACAPLGCVATHHVAVAVAEHGKRGVGLGTFGKQKLGAACHRVGPDLAHKTQRLQQRHHVLVQVRGHHRGLCGLLAFGGKGHAVGQGLA